MQKNGIYQGDCVDLLQQVEPGTVDLVFADPPFNIGYKYDVYDDAQQAEDYLAWCGQWIRGIHRALKSDGTFWLAIGDEFAAELKIESQKAGFHCRSWVIWYYTFGVNCRNGFSRSHTHLFHFVKDKKRFTFNRINPEIRVKSARQLVYADNRANPDGRLPDNTWITRPQDAPFFLSFNPRHDTWYFARVAGTFKEREGFHGCQMPEQLLARVIRTSSRPQDLVLDPFGGSGTTLSVAKKLGRNWMGFELSPDYVQYIQERLDRVQVGDPIDGPMDPLQSAPSTKQGKRKQQKFDAETAEIVYDAYAKAGDGLPADYILCDPEIDAAFVAECVRRGRGNAYIWNRYLLQMRKQGNLPKSTRKPPRLSEEQMDQFGYASEVAWRLLAIDYRKTLDDILCSPEFAAEFDRLAAEFGPTDREVSVVDYRRAAIAIRKRSHRARELAAEKFANWMRKKPRGITTTRIDSSFDALDCPGAFVLKSGNVGFFAGESRNMRDRIQQILDNSHWRGLDPDSIVHVRFDGSSTERFALKSALATRENSFLNCRLLLHDSEMPPKLDPIASA